MNMEVDKCQEVLKDLKNCLLEERNKISQISEKKLIDNRKSCIKKYKDICIQNCKIHPKYLI